MQARLRNVLTGKVVAVHSTTDSPDSSYGLECWVDRQGNSYGQCQFGAPFGFELLPPVGAEQRELLLSVQTRLGLTNKAMAERLGVDERTVERYRQGSRAIRGPALLLLRQLASTDAE